MLISLTDIPVHIHCPDGHSRFLVELNFANLLGSGSPKLSYSIEQAETGYILNRDEAYTLPVRNDAEFLYHLEKDMVIQVQYRRPDLYFIHGAVMTWGEQCCLIIAPSGGGKSTLAWALLESGFTYYTDELAPVDLDQLTVWPFDHAFCLKTPPPSPYRLPENAYATERAYYVPMPKQNLPKRRLTHLIFIDQPSAGPPVTEVSEGEASARLFANSLNALAHGNQGLSAARKLAEKTVAYCTHSRDLAVLVREIRRLMSDSG